MSDITVTVIDETLVPVTLLPVGPRGPVGSVGPVGPPIRIIGTLNSPLELPLTGDPGDAYIIAGDLYSWIVEPPGWESVGAFQGPQGIQGIQGLKGDQGDQGIQGLQGLQGDQGIQGIQGLKGDQGDQGIQGLQGDQGDQGIQGIQGIQGLKGDQGDQGIQGLQGLQGDKGDKGDVGDTHVPDPVSEADDRFLTTVDGALVYADAPEEDDGGLNESVHLNRDIVAYDSFVRPDGPIGTSDSGHVWEVTSIGDTQPITIVNNRVTATGSNLGGESFTLVDTGVKNVRVDWVTTSWQGGGGLWAIVAFVDMQNYIRCGIGGTVHRIQYVIDGVATSGANRNNFLAGRYTRMGMPNLGSATFYMDTNDGLLDVTLLSRSGLVSEVIHWRTQDAAICAVFAAANLTNKQGLHWPVAAGSIYNSWKFVARSFDYRNGGIV